jgi:hypothetical protein
VDPLSDAGTVPIVSGCWLTPNNIDFVKRMRNEEAARPNTIAKSAIFPAKYISKDIAGPGAECETNPNPVHPLRYGI